MDGGSQRNNRQRGHRFIGRFGCCRWSARNEWLRPASSGGRGRRALYSSLPQTSLSRPKVPNLPSTSGSPSIGGPAAVDGGGRMVHLPGTKSCPGSVGHCKGHSDRRAAGPGHGGQVRRSPAAVLPGTDLRSCRPGHPALHTGPVWSAPAASSCNRWSMPCMSVCSSRTSS